MKWADEQVRTRIAEAINEAEQRTSGEIVCVVAPSSDSYELVPVLWAALIAHLPCLWYCICCLSLTASQFIQFNCWFSLQSHWCSGIKRPDTGLYREALPIAVATGMPLISS